MRLRPTHTHLNLNVNVNEITRLLCLCVGGGLGPLVCALLSAAGGPARHAVRAHVLPHVSAQLPAQRTAQRAARRQLLAAAGPRAPRAGRGPPRPLPAPAVPTAHQSQVPAARLHSAAQVRLASKLLILVRAQVYE